MVTMARTSTCSTTEGFSRPVLNDSPRIEQIVGRERRERVSQLAWCGGGCFDSRRRVNSTVMLLLRAITILFLFVLLGSNSYLIAQNRQWRTAKANRLTEFDWNCA